MLITVQLSRSLSAKALQGTIFSIDLTRCEKYSISGDRAGDISICDLENYQHIFRFKSVHQSNKVMLTTAIINTN